MREIVFRARRKDNGDWVEGNYHYNKRKGVYHLISSFEDNISHKVYRESLQIKNIQNEWEEV